MPKKLENNKLMSIEETFLCLDKIISEMDSNKCTIEKSAELYESGVKLISDLSKKISKIEKDLKIISK